MACGCWNGWWRSITKASDDGSAVLSSAEHGARKRPAAAAREVAGARLAVEQGNPNKANVRFLVDNAALPADCGAYERLVVVFNGDDGDALAAARAAWTDCKSRGFEVTYWQADDRGRWQRRE
jgi:DNA polymerase IIIc chi subunit